MLSESGSSIYRAPPPPPIHVGATLNYIHSIQRPASKLLQSKRVVTNTIRPIPSYDANWVCRFLPAMHREYNIARV